MAFNYTLDLSCTANAPTPDHPDAIDFLSPRLLYANVSETMNMFLDMSASGLMPAWTYDAGSNSWSIGVSHRLTLRIDGTVVARGSDQFGQGSVPLGLADVVAVSASLTLTHPWRTRVDVS